MSFIRKVKIGNRIYLSEVENKRINGKVVQKHIRYVGKEADGKTIQSSSISNLQIEQVKIYGPLLILNHIAQEIHLPALLGKYGKEILSMVFAHCLDYKSINQMSEWFERTDLNMLLGLEWVTEARLLQALDHLESMNAVQLQKTIFESVKTQYDIDDKGVVYDVTNTYLYGKKCPFAKEGKDKEGVKGRPLLQIGLGVTHKHGVPILHKIFDGNVHDARTFADIITSLYEFHITDGLIVFDRGITSKSNQTEIEKLSWKVVCGVPIKESLKRFLRPIIADTEFVNYKNRVRLNKTIFYIVVKPYTLGEVKGTIAICFNEQQRKDLRESRYDDLREAQRLLAQSKTIKSGLEKYFDSKTKKLLLKEVEKAEEFNGYSVIFTTAQLTKEEIVKMYFDKDVVEKAFHSLKGVVGIQPIRHWLADRVSAHVFLCYIAYLLLTLLKLRLTKLDISPVEALRELESMYKVYMRDSKKDFKISRTVTLSKKQEEIIACVDRILLKNL